MRSFRLTEIILGSQPKSITVYRGLEQDKAEVHPAYLETLRLLSRFSSWSSTRESELQITYTYDQSQLSVSVSTYATAMDEAYRALPGSKWIPIKNEVAPEKLTLYGAADPLILDQRDAGLIDELIDSFPDETFRVRFVARSVPPDAFEQHLRAVETYIRRYSAKRGRQVSTQENFFKEVKTKLVGGERDSHQREDAEAEVQYRRYRNYYLTLRSADTHAFQVSIEIEAKPQLREQIAHVIMAFSFRTDIPSLHHVQRCRPTLSPDDPDSSPVLFGPAQVAALAALPFRERPGLRYRELVEFGTDPGESPVNARSFPLGWLMTDGETRIEVKFPLDDLTRHALVTGVTGSGKTTTIKHFLAHCLRQSIPFLVIEPAKTEYRALPETHVAVYRPGTYNDQLRINPLAFPEGVSVQTHLDLIKSVFNAAFPMYGPMPYLLETALIEVYQRRGWDLVTGRNVYESRLDRHQCFPTLQELVHAIRHVTESAGYSDDLTSDVRAALEVRVSSLLSGAKGRLLNTRTPLSVYELLSQSAIIELEAIGDDNEKVFLMGLLLTQIYEYYVGKGEYSDKLRHLLVFEEAHRLWENRKEAASLEVADVKGYAVKTMNNILSEIRAYGQGVVVSDQIPSRLASDVVKNTNTKIIHRLLAMDDREWVGKAIGLSDEQIEHLVHLRAGQAAVHWDLLDEAVLCKMHSHSAFKESRRKLEISALTDSMDPSFIFSRVDAVGKAEAIVRTALLHNLDDELIDKKLVSLVKSIADTDVIPGTETDSATKAEEVSIWATVVQDLSRQFTAELATRIVRDWVSRGLISIIDEVEFEKAVSSGALNPIALLRTTFRRAVARIPNHPIYGLVPHGRKVRALFPRDWPSPSFRSSLYQKWATSLRRNQITTQASPARYSELASTLRLTEFFAVDLLSPAQRLETLDAIVVACLGPDDELVQQYLDIVDFVPPRKSISTERSPIQPEAASGEKWQQRAEEPQTPSEDVGTINVHGAHQQDRLIEAIMTTLKQLASAESMGRETQYHLRRFTSFGTLVLAIAAAVMSLVALIMSIWY